MLDSIAQQNTGKITFDEDRDDFDINKTSPSIQSCVFKAKPEGHFNDR